MVARTGSKQQWAVHIFGDAHCRKGAKGGLNGRSAVPVHQVREKYRIFLPHDTQRWPRARIVAT